MTEPSPQSDPSAPHPGLRYARWGGRALGLYLLLVAGIILGGAPDGSFPVVQAAYFVLYGSLITLRLDSLAPKFWKPTFVVICVLSAGFVFVMIVDVMFAYMAAAEQGERLGVPGLEGTMVFLALLQPPVILFQRHPDLLD